MTLMSSRYPTYVSRAHTSMATTYLLLSSEQTYHHGLPFHHDTMQSSVGSTLPHWTPARTPHLTTSTSKFTPLKPKESTAMTTGLLTRWKRRSQRKRCCIGIGERNWHRRKTLRRRRDVVGDGVAVAVLRCWVFCCLLPS